MESRSCPPLYLASRSPRRKELLTQAGIRFQVFVPQEPELDAPKSRKRVSAKEIVKRICRAKAMAALNELKAQGVTEALVLTADTLVFQNHKVLGKPANEAEARKMLQTLSGKWHEVYTGVAVALLKGESTKINQMEVRTRVRFFRLKPQWIDWYIATGEPFDKAGSYGCQGYGAALVERFEGSYTNVVGLPLGEALALLEKAAKVSRSTLQGAP
ncbi:MAG TPA: Maf family protein [Bdellovibrionota bacterium]|jgi:septum formation protein